jgi:EpsI family protein
VSEGRQTSRFATAAVWLVLLAGLAAAFGQNFAEMWKRWFPSWHRVHLSLYDRIVRGESYYTHSPLVPLVSLLISVLLIRHTRITVRSRPVAGLVLLAGSLLLHLLGCLARVNFVSGFAFVGVLCGLVLSMWGATALRRLWFPIAFLVFMIPLPEVTIASLNFRLKMIAADWGVRLVDLLGVVAARSGNQVYLTGGKSMVIANVCNGLRTLISLLAFGSLYAYVCRLRGLWRLGLFAMTVPVAVISNSVRILSLILVADTWDTQTAVGWYHDFSGILIFVLAFLLMFGLERGILWSRRLAGRPAPIEPLFKGVLRSPDDEGQWPTMVRAASLRGGRLAAVAVVLAAGAAWWLNRSVPPVWNRQLAAQAMPREINIAGRTWHGYDRELDDQTLTILETRDYLFRQYVSAGASAVDFCVIFSQDNRKGTHPPDLCLEGTGQDIVVVRDFALSSVQGRENIPCREIIVQAGREKHYFIYTYKCGQSYTNSFWRQQMVIFANGLLHRNAAGALIRVSAKLSELPDSRQEAREFLREAIPYLDRSLP